MAYVFDREAGQFVCDFVERLPTTGTGKLFSLYDWQREALMEFYGTMDVPESGTDEGAERLRRYSPLCYVAPILPAQPPLKVRYHALTAFPSAHSCDLEETHQTEKGDRHDAANAERIPNPHG